MMELGEDHLNLMRKIRRDSKRPSPSSKEWNIFCELCDAGLVEDCGGGFAELTESGLRALGRKP